tara:strand:- start:742 stop:957 length:216 start_codon:yes stop_codon:yes gene_type:complete
VYTFSISFSSISSFLVGIVVAFFVLRVRLFLLFFSSVFFFDVFFLLLFLQTKKSRSSSLYPRDEKIKKEEE